MDPESMLDAKLNVGDKDGEQGMPATGIPYVIVGRMVVVENSKYKKVWAGQPIRYPVTSETKYENISQEEWRKEHGISNFSIEGSLHPEKK